MIERIYARNFRRIGECDIDLRNGMTVLIGKNGTGKSSIIESITFNLYGKIKDKTNKDSVRRKNAPDGESTLTVVDFALDGAYYRCRRWYTPKMSTMATLYSYTPEEYEILSKKPITEQEKEIGTEIASSTTGVTAAIVSLIGVSFDGFKASFVAQQKELSSFAGLAPESRKKFFLNLLGYASLDDVKPELAAKTRHLKGQVEGIATQSLNKESIQRDIERSEKQQERLSSSVERGTQTVEDAENRYNAAAQEYEDVRIIAEKVATLESDIARLVSERSNLISECETLTKNIESDTETCRGYDPSVSVVEKLSQAREKQRLDREAKDIRSKKEQLEEQERTRKAALGETENEMERLRVLTAKEPDVDEPSRKVAELRAQYQVLLSRQNTANQNAERLSGLLTSVNRGEMAKCPTCGNDIGDENGRAHLESELSQTTQEIYKLEQEKASVQQNGTTAKKAMEIAQAAARTYNDNVKALERASSIYERDKQDYGKIVAELQQIRESEEKTRGNILSERDGFKLNEEIIKLEGQKTVEETMRAAAQRLEKNKQAREFKQQRIADIDREMDEKSKFVKDNKRRAESAPGKLQKKSEAEQKLRTYRQALQQRQSDAAEINGKLGQLRGNLVKAIQQSEQMEALKERLEDSISAQKVIETLREELPARIAPRLADVTGHLLDIATNGRYSMIELDDQYNVHVYTDDDIRPLAQMSGGESDVISLCLRIAVAKILLEASGRPTQTFILDEIFGALDDERRESTCSALLNIQDELSKILCITHIDEIKDMADWTYVVEMDENGTSWVREQTNTLQALMGRAEEKKISEEREQEENINTMSEAETVGGTENNEYK